MNELLDLITKELVKFEFKEKEPPLYKVLIINDPITPMFFVVKILMSVFHKNRTVADKVMLDAHLTGSAVCGTYPKDVAEMKVKLVKAEARKNKYPLNCLMEEE